MPVSPDYLSSIGDIALLVSQVKELSDALDLEREIKHTGMVLSPLVGRPADHRADIIKTLGIPSEAAVFPNSHYGT